MTYEELIALAKEHYNEGGDVYVECWSEKDYEEFCKEFGPLTKKDALYMMQVYEEERRAACMWVEEQLAEELPIDNSLDEDLYQEDYPDEWDDRWADIARDVGAVTIL